MTGRIRKLRPEFWSSPDVAAMTRSARLLFIGLWTYSDDAGHLLDSPARLRLALFPGDWDVDDEAVRGWLDELIGLGSVERVEDADGVALLHVVNLRKHQGITGLSKSRFAMPDVAPDESHGRTHSTARAATRAAADSMPADFPSALLPALGSVVEILTELAAVANAAAPSRGGTARCIADYPDRDHVKVARDYRAWQLDVARRKHKSVVRGYRTQLDMADPVARRATGQSQADRLARQEEKLRRAGL